MIAAPVKRLRRRGNSESSKPTDPPTKRAPAEWQMSFLLAGRQVPILNIARKHGENDTIPPILNG